MILNIDINKKPPTQEDIAQAKTQLRNMTCLCCLALFVALICLSSGSLLVSIVGFVLMAGSIAFGLAVLYHQCSVPSLFEPLRVDRCEEVIEFIHESGVVLIYVEEVKSQKRELVFAEYLAMQKYMVHERIKRRKLELYGTGFLQA